MSRTIRPGGGVSDAISTPGTGPAWLITAACGVAAAASGLLSLAGAIASLLSGAGWRWRTGWSLPLEVARGHPEKIWPGINSAWLWVCSGVLLAVLVFAVVAVVVAIARWRDRRTGPAGAMAGPRDVAARTGAAAARTAHRLRPSLTGPADDRQLGVRVGSLHTTGEPMWASWEDTLLALMGPRAGKTTSLTVPPILAAPGVVLATSMKADVLTDTIALRGQRGHCWVFDPCEVAYSEQHMWWDPLAAAKDVEGAQRLSGHFTQEISSRGADFWISAAQDLLAALILAAARADRPGGLSLVWQWLSDQTDPEPVDILDRSGFGQIAAGLQSRQNSPPETRGGIYETARTAAQCLQSDKIMRWVTPPTRPDIPQLRLRDLFVPRPDGTPCADTVYLLSVADNGAAQPLVAALVDEVFHIAQRAAQARAGRLDPPLLAVLDEAANICKIRRLPQLYSVLGSQGVVPATVLQSYEQGSSVWGETGMHMLWGASTVKVVGAGVASPRLAQDISILVGEHDVPVASRSRDQRGGWSESVSVQRRRILDPSDVAALPTGQAILLTTGARPALIDLEPWYRGEDAAEVAAGRADQQAQLTARASDDWAQP